MSNKITTHTVAKMTNALHIRQENIIAVQL